MKNFESQYNRWIDGSLSGPECEAFEAQLGDAERSAAADWTAVRAAMKEAAGEIRVAHPDFLNSRVLESIARAGRAEPRPARTFRLAWAGAACLALAVALTAIFLPRGTPGPFSTTVVSAWAPGTSAGAFAAPGGRGAVIWIDAAAYIPAEESVR